jgi:hypothetical protein
MLTPQLTDQPINLDTPYYCGEPSEIRVSQTPNSFAPGMGARA